MRDGVSLDWQSGLDSNWVEHWEYLLFSGDSSVACLSGGVFYVCLNLCRVCRSFRIRAAQTFV